MKIDVGKGYRVYFTQRGNVLVIILCGGDNPPRPQISSAPRPSRKSWSFNMKVSELMEFDASKYLKDENDYRLYLAQAFAGGDPIEIQAALGDVAKARGMTALARESGIAREALYRALSNKGNAEFATIMKVIGAMGLHLTLAKPEAVPKVAAKAKTAAKAVVA
jgi:probable addiction module antidote protein